VGLGGDGGDLAIRHCRSAGTVGGGAHLNSS